MIKIIVNDIVPILVIMALGYICGRVHYFDDDQRQGLNKVVLDIALPAALFVSIVKATREMLASDLVLTILSLVGVTGMFMLSYLLCKKLFHHTTQEAAVCALIAGSPTIGFLGFAVLDPIYGNDVTTNLVIGIVSIVVNAVTIPLGFYLINKGQSEMRAKAAKGTKAVPAASTAASAAVPAAGSAAAASAAASAAVPAAGSAAVDDAKAPSAPATPARAPVTDQEARAAEKEHGIRKEIDVIRAEERGHAKKHAIKNPNVAAIVNAVKKPVAAAPLIAVLLVLIGVRFPSELDPCFELIAKANSGVAVLAAGLALSTVSLGVNKEVIWNTFYRLILMPAVIVAAGFALGMGSDPSKISMLAMAVALPPAFSGIIISSRYNIYVKEGANSVAVSTVCFAATCILWVWVMPILCSMFH
ncbi:AEC family transporter [Caniella muris]|uniref:AEC family transporter n=1 Tax=Caniella muris TaxID=2941502 RepID=UPI00203B17D1|nr:AEC family transporter [Caniella muris]